MTFKYKWKNDKSKYLWQERTYNIFAKQGWKSDDLELFRSVSEEIISKDYFNITFLKGNRSTGIVIKVDGVSFKNQALFLQHEINDYLEEVSE